MEALLSVYPGGGVNLPSRVTLKEALVVLDRVFREPLGPSTEEDVERIEDISEFVARVYSKRSSRSLKVTGESAVLDALSMPSSSVP